MEGTSLPPAFYPDISIDSHLQTDFLPFLAWIMENADFSVACGIGVFSILTAVVFQKCTTASSETKACEEERLKPSFTGWLKPTLTQVWKQHISQNRNMPWEFLLWKF